MKIKKNISFLIFIVMMSMQMTVSADNTEFAWYVKRSGNSQPPLDERQKNIYDYDAYYLDKKLNDSSSDKRLYITFDLGYVNENTLSIAETLKEENVPAAFFILDNILLKNADFVTELVEDGHLICNHTKNHKNLSNSSFEEISDNIGALEKLYEEKTGKIISKYFRFPEGKYSESALQCVKNLGYKTIFWSFAYDDWDNNRQPNAQKSIKKILENTHNGAVILLHPTSKTNAQILPLLISNWRKMGYEFSTLDELVKE